MKLSSKGEAELSACRQSVVHSVAADVAMGLFVVVPFGKTPVVIGLGRGRIPLRPNVGLRLVIRTIYGLNTGGHTGRRGFRRVCHAVCRGAAAGGRNYQ